MNKMVVKYHFITELVHFQVIKKYLKSSFINKLIDFYQF
jgi:hypothetical protein